MEELVQGKPVYGFMVRKDNAPHFLNDAWVKADMSDLWMKGKPIPDVYVVDIEKAHKLQSFKKAVKSKNHVEQLIVIYLNKDRTVSRWEVASE